LFAVYNYRSGTTSKTVTLLLKEMKNDNKKSDLIRAKIGYKKL